MLTFEPLTIEAKPIFDRYLSHFNPKASELSFTNLFMWRHKYNFHYTVIENFLWVLNITSQGKWYFSPPIGDYSLPLASSVKILQQYLSLQNRSFVIKKADVFVLSALSEALPGKISAKEVRDDFDYLYNFEALQKLAGKTYHKKKNHLNKFIKTTASWAYHPLSQNLLPKCTAFLDRWCMARSCEEDLDLTQEKNAILEVFNHFDALNVTGGLIIIDGAVEAFTFGERLNASTTVIHIEKANPDYDSLYTVINNQYLVHHPHPTELVNREQDMGVEGLRKAKESWHPVGYVEKHTIEILL